MMIPSVDRLDGMRTVITALLLASAAFAQHADPDRPESDAPGSEYIGNPEAIAAGRETYMLVCSGCHGATGGGGRGPDLVTGRGVARAEDDELFDVIKDGIPGSDMPPSPLPDEQVWQMTAFVRNLSAPAIQQGVPGDPAAGREVYYGKGGCNNCHMIRGEGGYLGPDLTNLGITQNIGRIQEGLLDVNKRFTEGFDPVTVTLADGSRIQGSARNYSNYRIQVLDRDGKMHLLDRQKVKVEFRENSWMPANYDERLGDDEMQNLFAFLSRQSVRGGAAQ